MKTESHYRVGKMLMKKAAGGRWGMLARLLFLWGCVEPDCNPFSYLKGWKNKPFAGHSYASALPYTMRLYQKLKKSNRRSALYFFRLGHYLHYVMDAFTYPHNDIFTGSMLAHVTYEKTLHGVFVQMLARNDAPFAPPADLPAFLAALHENYLAAPPAMETDIHFSLLAIRAVAESLLPKAYSDRGSSEKQTATSPAPLPSSPARSVAIKEERKKRIR